PNYYLGPVTGSICDSLTTGINELEHNFNFSIAPNPSAGTFKLMYLLPQNKSGTLRVYDVTGREVYSMRLPPWSTMQNLNLSTLPNGIYHTTITSDIYRVSKKIVILQ
ncbi:MAG: T9SS type A sorting domain-containing protein, partial [Bacteroidia bacterium]|nr:T9SS type A sorting domain-containing protein [Bacteroidia bacterium]